MCEWDSMLQRSHKGEWCWVDSKRFCQEESCSECQTYSSWRTNNMEDWMSDSTTSASRYSFLTVVKRTSFDAAHYLPDHPTCGEMHGHRWTVELGVWGKVGKNGMVVDFAGLKSFLEGIKGVFDHKVVNDVIAVPTAENICLYVVERFHTCDWREGELDLVRVWETPDSYVEWRC